MNVNNNAHVNLAVSNKEVKRSPASQFALQIALQTMKERCQKLQNRLSCLEEENLYLRLEKHKLTMGNKNDTCMNVSGLEKKVAELSRQKSQLSHHILMVATENKQLWERLSKLTEENECLGNTLLTITDSLRQSPRTLKPDKSINIVDSCFKSRDGKDHSLDEVSLKALNSLMKGKPLLDNQSVQSEELLELENGTVSLEKCGFVLVGKDENEEDESLLLELKELLEQTKNQKIILKQQQEGLRAALEIFKQISKDNSCKQCQLRAEEENERLLEKSDAIGTETKTKSVEHDPSHLKTDKGTEIDVNSEIYVLVDRICPICEKVFSESISFSVFNKHVVSHFGPEGTTEDTLTTKTDDDIIHVYK